MMSRFLLVAALNAKQDGRRGFLFLVQQDPGIMVTKIVSLNSVRGGVNVLESSGQPCD